ncbi:CapA family protein, partial [Patescibacteria group bacterium]|nr:CapA family protein [Patescibacteria group bacterium]
MNKRIGFVLFVLFLISAFFFLIHKNQFPFVSPVYTKELVSLLPAPWKPPTMTLETIFSNDHSWVNDIPIDKKWTLIATGDIIPARSVNFQTVKDNDFTWAWKNIIPILSQGDITLINLE